MAKYTVEVYQIDVTAGTFARIDSFGNFKNLSFANVLNGIGNASFRLAVQDPKATQANLIRFRNQIAIKRNGTVVFFGPITEISGGYEGVQGYLDIECNSYLIHLMDRLTQKLRTENADLATIASTLVTYTQGLTNGDLNIDIGTIQTTGTTEKVVFERAKIAEALVGLSQRITGMDFDFIPVVNSAGLVTSVRFNTYFPRLGSLRTDLNPLKIGSNVKSIQFKTLDTIYNEGTAEGSGTGSQVVDSTLSYGASQIGYTRREIFKAFKGVSQPATLSAFLTAYMNQKSVEQFTVDVELYQDHQPTFGSYGLGDRLMLEIQVGNYIDFTGQQARVLGIAVNVTDEGGEIITPKLQLIP